MSYSGQEYARSFMMHRAALLHLLDQIPSEQAGFRAWEDGMSFHALADHLAGSSERLGALVGGAAPGPVQASPDFDSARERLRTGAARTQDLLSSLTPEQLARPIQAFGGREMPVSALADFVIQHEAHHKGQVWLMARMIGVQPPMFVRLG